MPILLQTRRRSSPLQCRAGGRSPRSPGFTLVELLVSVAIFALLMVVVLNLIGVAQNAVTTQRARSGEFREARAVLERMADAVSGATLHSYWAYGDYNTHRRVDYVRTSDGHFVSGPVGSLLAADHPAPGHGVFFQTLEGQAPGPDGSVVGQPFNLVQCLGFYVDFNSDLEFRPAFLRDATDLYPERRRFRLMEFRLPSEESVIYSSEVDLNNESTPRNQAMRWFRGPFRNGGSVRDHSIILADNVLGLIIAPRYVVVEMQGGNLSENSTVTTLPARDFLFDSREAQWGAAGQKAEATMHQLPPALEVTLVVTDESSYSRQASALGEDELAAAVRDAFAGLFADYNDIDDDLQELEERLNELGLNHRLFSTNIGIRGARFVVEEFRL